MNIAAVEISNIQTKYIRIGTTAGEDVSFGQSTVIDIGPATGQGGTLNDGSGGFVTLPISLISYLNLGSSNSFDTSRQDLHFTLNNKGIITSITTSIKQSYIQTYSDVSNSSSDGQSLLGTATATNLSFKKILATSPLTVTSNTNSVIINLPQSLGLVDGVSGGSAGYSLINTVPVSSRTIQLRNLVSGSTNIITLSDNNTSDQLLLDVNVSNIDISKTTGSIPSSRVSGLQNSSNSFKGLSDAPSGNYIANSVISVNSSANGLMYLPAPTTNTTLTFDGLNFNWKQIITSIGLVMPAMFTTTNSPLTASGTITTSLVSQNANNIFAAPSSSNGTPSFRQLVPSDIPNIDASSITTGTMALGRLGTGTPDTTKFLRGDNSWQPLATNIGLSLPSIFTVTNSPLTTSGTILASLINQPANNIFASPNGSSGTPLFRALVASDIPNLDASVITTGTLSLGILGTGTPDTTMFLRGDNSWQTSVTSIDLSLPSIFTVSNTPIQTSGTIVATLGLQPANNIFAAPDGSSGTPIFRALVASDIPNIDASAITTGTMNAARLGTGVSDNTSFLRGDNTWQPAVIKVGLSLPSIFTVSTSSVNTTGTLTASLGSQSANNIFAAPDGSSGTPTFRSLVSDDIPNLDASIITTGIMNAAILGTGTPDTTMFLRGDSTWQTSVTSIDLSLPSIFTVSNTPIETTGTLTATLGSQSANNIFAAPDGSSGTPTFRSLVASDIPNLDASIITTGTFSLSRLATGTASDSTYLRGDGTWWSPQGNGTVTSIDLSLPLIFTVSNTPIETSGTIVATLGSQSANTIFAAPDGSSGTPVFRLLVSDDIPNLDTSIITTGIMNAARLGTGSASDSTYLRGDGTWWSPQGNGTVTSIDLSLPSIFTISNTPIETSGTIVATLGSQSANNIFAAPNGSSGTPVFRSLVSSDIPNLDASIITTGTLSLSRLGTGTPDTTMFLRGDNSWQTSVTNVGLSLPSIFTVSNSSVSTTGTLTATLGSQSANNIFAAPNGSSGTPLFRSLVSADIPSLDASIITTGTLSLSRLGTGTPDTTMFLRGDNSWQTSVTNVGLSLPSIFTVSNSSVSTTGTLTATLGSQSANNIFAAPNGSSGTPLFRSLVSSDIPNLDASIITTGIVNTSRLGSGSANTLSYLRGDGTWQNSVTNVGLSLPSIFTVSNSSVSTSGTLTATLGSQSANNIFAAPNGSSGTPVFRSLVSSDIPNLDASIITTGIMNTARLGSGTSDTTKFLRGDNSWQTSVTNVTVSVPSELLAVSNSSITTSGTIALSLQKKPANNVLIGPASGSASTPTFRALITDDIPNLDHSWISDFDTQVRQSTLDEMAVPINSVNMNNQTIINVLDPVNKQDASTRNYVDNSIKTMSGVIMSPTAFTSGSVTLTAAQMLGGILLFNGSTAHTFTITSDTAANLVSQLQIKNVNTGVILMVINTSNQLAQFSSASGVTFSGNYNSSTSDFQITAGSTKQFIIYFTNVTSGSESVTIYG